MKTNSVTIKRFTYKSLFKLSVIGAIGGGLFFTILCFIAYCFGKFTAHFTITDGNGNVLKVLDNDFFSIAISFLVTLVFLVVLLSIFYWVFLCFGSLIYSKFRDINLQYIAKE